MAIPLGEAGSERASNKYHKLILIIRMPDRLSTGWPPIRKNRPLQSLRRLQYPQRPQGDPFVGLAEVPVAAPGLAGITVLQRPAALLVLFVADQLQRVAQAWVLPAAQPDQHLDVLQQVGDVEDREAELPPVAAGFGVLAGWGRSPGRDRR